MGSITFKCNRLHYNYFLIFMITLHYDYINFAESANFQICTTLHQTNKTFYPFMITTLPPTPSQIYICLINQSINQIHLRYKYCKTCLYYIISCFLFCILFLFFCCVSFFSFFKEFIYNFVYCNLLLLTHVLL